MYQSYSKKKGNAYNQDLAAFVDNQPIQAHALKVLLSEDGVKMDSLGSSHKSKRKVTTQGHSSGKEEIHKIGSKEQIMSEYKEDQQ